MATQAPALHIETAEPMQSADAEYKATTVAEASMVEKQRDCERHHGGRRNWSCELRLVKHSPSHDKATQAPTLHGAYCHRDCEGHHGRFHSWSRGHENPTELPPRDWVCQIHTHTKATDTTRRWCASYQTQEEREILPKAS